MHAIIFCQNPAAALIEWMLPLATSFCSVCDLTSEMDRRARARSVVAYRYLCRFKKADVWALCNFHSPSIDLIFGRVACTARAAERGTTQPYQKLSET